MAERALGSLVTNYEFFDLAFKFIISPILGAGVWWVKGINKTLGDIKAELTKMNHRVTHLEEWKVGHEQFATSMIDSLRREIASVRRDKDSP